MTNQEVQTPVAPLALPSSLPGCRIDQIRQNNEYLELSGSTTSVGAHCPTCGLPSRSVHSTYSRTLRDLPIATWRVRLVLTVRRFWCSHARCPRRTFAEPLTDIAPAFARRTTRLTALLTHLALLLGGQAGHRLAQTMRTPVSRDTLLRIIRRSEPPPAPPPSIIGIDDWAFAKRRSYGTIVVDLERHRPISLLPDRDATTVAAWLATHPSVEVISRDRSTEYARAATLGAPQAQQVADRWHLLQNLREVLERLLQRLRLGRTVVLPVQPTSTTDATTALRPRRLRPLSTSERARKEASQLRRASRYETIHDLIDRGLSRRAVARLMGLSPTTVNLYARAERTPERAVQAAQASMLDPYLPYLQQRWEEGCTNAQQLWREVRERGYEGGTGQVRRWAQYQRRESAPTTPKRYRQNVEAQPSVPTTRVVSEPPLQAGSPRQASWLLLRRMDELAEGDQVTVRRLLKHPTVVAAQRLAERFQRMVRERQADAFDQWLLDGLESGIPELTNFAGGLKRDEDAVRNSLKEAWSQGQTEGQITRVKLIRRQMYGRGNLDLLSRRVLVAA